MSPKLKSALEEARTLAADRSWVLPGPAAVTEAGHLLALTEAIAPRPALQVEPDGCIVLEWEVAGRGWLTLSVNGGGTVTHAGVIDGDEYAQAETLGSALPDWATELLHRLFGGFH